MTAPPSSRPVDEAEPAPSEPVCRNLAVMSGWDREVPWRLDRREILRAG